MAVQERLYTADDLWVLSHADTDEDKRYELDEGTLIERALAGDIHGAVAVWVGHLIAGYVAGHDSGEVSGAETGYRLSMNPDTVRAPDVGFIVKARLQPLTGKYYTLAPDLAVEVISPSDSARQIRRKANQYLAAGTRLVWVIYPEDREVDVYRPGHDPRTFKIGEALDGGDVLPGFTLPVKDIFARLRD
jgi:Uma2 family endonuclease